MDNDTPHPQDEEFAQFTAQLATVGNDKLVLTALKMLIEGSDSMRPPHPNRWISALLHEVSARLEGYDEALKQQINMMRIAPSFKARWTAENR